MGVEVYRSDRNMEGGCSFERRVDGGKGGGKTILILTDLPASSPNWTFTLSYCVVIMLCTHRFSNHNIEYGHMIETIQIAETMVSRVLWYRYLRQTRCPYPDALPLPAHVLSCTLPRYSSTAARTNLHGQSPHSICASPGESVVTILEC